MFYNWLIWFDIFAVTSVVVKSCLEMICILTLCEQPEKSIGLNKCDNIYLNHL